MTLLLIYLFIALFISFICSIMEAVLLSTPISWLKSRLESGDKTAGTMLTLKDDMIYYTNKPAFDDLINNLEDLKAQLKVIDWSFELTFPI